MKERTNELKKARTNEPTNELTK